MGPRPDLADQRNGADVQNHVLTRGLDLLPEFIEMFASQVTDQLQNYLLPECGDVVGGRCVTLSHRSHGGLSPNSAASRSIRWRTFVDTNRDDGTTPCIPRSAAAYWGKTRTSPP